MGHLIAILKLSEPLFGPSGPKVGRHGASVNKHFVSKRPLSTKLLFTEGLGQQNFCGRRVVRLSWKPILPFFIGAHSGAELLPISPVPARVCSSFSFINEHLKDQLLDPEG